jgi:hypothetical protein
MRFRLSKNSATPADGDFAASPVTRAEAIVSCDKDLLDHSGPEPRAIDARSGCRLLGCSTGPVAAALRSVAAIPSRRQSTFARSPSEPTTSDERRMCLVGNLGSASMPADDLIVSQLSSIMADLDKRRKACASRSCRRPTKAAPSATIAVATSAVADHCSGVHDPKWSQQTKPTIRRRPARVSHFPPLLRLKSRWGLITLRLFFGLHCGQYGHCCELSAPAQCRTRRK